MQNGNFKAFEAGLADLNYLNTQYLPEFLNFPRDMSDTYCTMVGRPLF